MSCPSAGWRGRSSFVKGRNRSHLEGVVSARIRNRTDVVVVVEYDHALAWSERGFWTVGFEVQGRGEGLV